MRINYGRSSAPVARDRSPSERTGTTERGLCAPRNGISKPIATATSICTTSPRWATSRSTKTATFRRSTWPGPSCSTPTAKDSPATPSAIMWPGRAARCSWITWGSACDERREVTSELHLMTRNGQSITVQLRSIPIVGPLDDTLCKTAITDITERRKMEEAIRQIEGLPANGHRRDPGDHAGHRPRLPHLAGQPRRPRNGRGHRSRGLPGLSSTLPPSGCSLRRKERLLPAEPGRRNQGPGDGDAHPLRFRGQGEFSSRSPPRRFSTNAAK